MVLVKDSTGGRRVELGQVGVIDIDVRVWTIRSLNRLRILKLGKKGQMGARGNLYTSGHATAATP